MAHPSHQFCKLAFVLLVCLLLVTTEGRPVGRGTGSTKPKTKCHATHKIPPHTRPKTNTCRSFTSNFTNGKRIVLQENYNGNPKSADFIDISGVNGAGWRLTKEGLEVTLLPPPKGSTEGLAITFNSTYKMEYGSVEVTLKTNGLGGFVTAFILMSPHGDEIDLEWVGKEQHDVQSNYFFQGYPIYGVNSYRNPVLGGAVNATFHDYKISWSPNHIAWFVDGKLTHTINRNSTKNQNGFCDNIYHMPYEPSYLQFGVWDGSHVSGWSGGKIDWKHQKKPLSAVFKQITVTCDEKWNKVIHG